MAGCIGMDIHKRTITVAQHDGPVWTVERTPARLAHLASRLATLHPAVIVLEPSGGYEQAVLDACHQQHLPVARVAPRQVRHFIEGIGVHATSDRLDARMLALYGASTQPRLTPAPTPLQQRVARLSTVRRTLRDDIVAKTHQLAEQPAEVRAIYARVMAALQTELEAVSATITALVETAPAWTRTREVLGSCPGVGAHSVALILAELPELGQLDGKAIAALVGVAPFTKQRGDGAGTAKIAGGREQVRAGLWMPTRTAMRCNPTIASLAARLRAKRKHEKVVTIACMRKLVTILHAMVHHDQCWHPPVLA